MLYRALVCENIENNKNSDSNLQKYLMERNDLYRKSIDYI